MFSGRSKDNPLTTRLGEFHVKAGYIHTQKDILTGGNQLFELLVNLKDGDQYMIKQEGSSDLKARATTA